METKLYTTIDRAARGWPAGPWDCEPDKVQWPDETTGLPCLAVRNRYAGNWCGYVGLLPEHPLYGKNYDGDGMDFKVHGGLTFANKGTLGVDEAQGIHYAPGLGEAKDVWWLGFDCGHSWDFSPQDRKDEDACGFPFVITLDRQYRTLAYVQRQCAELAAQVMRVAVGAAQRD